MASIRVSKEILNRRAGFDAWIFAFGTAMLAFIVVPITAFYLRSWRVIIYYLAALILVSIISAFVLEGSDQTASFAIRLLISIPFNVAYAYAIVIQLKGEAKEAIKSLESGKYSFSESSETIATETRIIKALADQGSMTVGHICAATGCSAVDIETELRRMVEMGLVSRELSHDNPPIYQVI